MIIQAHLVLALLFAAFILTDRFIFRKFLEKERRESYYRSSKKPLILTAALLIVTGFVLANRLDFSLHLVLKSGAALLLLFMFFNCPKFMQRAKCEDCKKIYRSFITLLLLLVVYLGMTV